MSQHARPAPTRRDAGGPSSSAGSARPAAPTLGFDRIPRRAAPGASGAPRRAGSARDTEGRGALFSGAAQKPPPGSITLTCSSCRCTSVLTPLRLLTLSIPSVHVWPLRWHYPSWMRCPACRRRTWVALAITF